MQPGSLVEVVCSCDGYAYVNGVSQQMAENISIGEILTISEITPGLDIDGKTQESVILSEKWHNIHPVLGLKCGFDKLHFREIQPPMEVSIQDIISQPENV